MTVISVAMTIFLHIDSAVFVWDWQMKWFSKGRRCGAGYLDWCGSGSADRGLLPALDELCSKCSLFVIETLCCTRIILFFYYRDIYLLMPREKIEER